MIAITHIPATGTSVGVIWTMWTVARVERSTRATFPSGSGPLSSGLTWVCLVFVGCRGPVIRYVIPPGLRGPTHKPAVWP